MSYGLAPRVVGWTGVDWVFKIFQTGLRDWTFGLSDLTFGLQDWIFWIFWSPIIKFGNILGFKPV